MFSFLFGAKFDGRRFCDEGRRGEVGVGPDAARVQGGERGRCRWRLRAPGYIA